MPCVPVNEQHTEILDLWNCVANGVIWALLVSEVTQSCPTLCNPVDCSLPGSSLHGILQARILEWVAISFSRGSSQPRDRTRVSHIADRRFNCWATREAHMSCMIDVKSLCLSEPQLPYLLDRDNTHSFLHKVFHHKEMVHGLWNHKVWCHLRIYSNL